ncbi:MAG: hypothetical protein H7145_07985 [Akkermansiaceae bacterium]|nr:hypothetical protein [Armatimonadota bacterium]
MSSEHNGGPNEPLEFKILEFEAGFLSELWVHGTTKLGSDKDLEGILNRFGAEGWDVIHYVPAAGSTGRRIILRRRAR